MCVPVIGELNGQSCLCEAAEPGRSGVVERRAQVFVLLGRPADLQSRLASVAEEGLDVSREVRHGAGTGTRAPSRGRSSPGPAGSGPRAGGSSAAGSSGRCRRFATNTGIARQLSRWSFPWSGSPTCIPRHSAPHLDGLTAQQREIVTLAGHGLTNGEIADRLFLSPRTVASHLYRSYPKLGIVGRHQLRDLVDRLERELGRDRL
jgi:DNA-binding CsgD family transcriptional regulator